MIIAILIDQIEIWIIYILQAIFYYDNLSDNRSVSKHKCAKCPIKPASWAYSIAYSAQTVKDIQIVWEKNCLLKKYSYYIRHDNKIRT